MLGKIANLRILPNLSNLSRILVNQGSTSNIRCFSICSTSPTFAQSATCTPKPIARFKNILSPSSSQLSKFAGKSYIQTRLHSATGDHSTLWKLERIVASAFLPLLPLCFILENNILDSVLAVLTVAHLHWGLEALIVDYARPIVVGNVLPKVFHISLYLVSALTLAGLMVLIFNGPGLTKVIKCGWSIGKDK